MAAMTKQISLTASECDATSLPGEVGSHATLQTYIPEWFFSFSWIFHQKIEMLPLKKVRHSPN